MINLNKNVYSIVLTDNVIRAVDEEAYRLGTNRSNLINQILAERLSCITPEMRMRTIFDAVSELVDSACIRQQQSEAVMKLRTALEYKYRPTVSYRLELERIPSDYLGRLKINIRTQNAELRNFFAAGFAHFASIEKGVELSRGRGGGRLIWSVSDSGCVRYFLNPKDVSDDMKGEALGNYIALLTKAVKFYFADTDSIEALRVLYKNEYESFREKYEI